MPSVKPGGALCLVLPEQGVGGSADPRTKEEGLPQRENVAG